MQKGGRSPKLMLFGMEKFGTPSAGHSNSNINAPTGCSVNYRN